MRLNGWRRLAIALFGTWLIMCSVLICVCVAMYKPSMLVSIGPPEESKMTIGEGTIKLPDGKVVSLQPANAKLDPWDINWSLETDVPLVAHILWQKLLFITFIAPLLLWLLSELLVVVVIWIRIGFRDISAP